MRSFTNETLYLIVRHVQEALKQTNKLSFAVPNPDLSQGLFSGEQTQGLRHRPWRVWLDLAEKLECRFLTPELISATHVCVTLEKLRTTSLYKATNKTEKYGLGSDFQRIQKLEESSFLLDYLEALERVQLKPQSRVLSLGVNSAEEFKLFDYLDLSQECNFVGIDHSESALSKARVRFGGANYEFICSDINTIDALELGKFDLILALGSLQSPSIDDRTILRKLVQSYLTEQASLIIAFPNSIYKDAELLYGARMKNFSQADLSLLFKDVAYYRKYLHQHKFKVFVTGKYYSLITAIPA